MGGIIIMIIIIISINVIDGAGGGVVGVEDYFFAYGTYTTSVYSVLGFLVSDVNVAVAEATTNSSASESTITSASVYDNISDKAWTS